MCEEQYPTNVSTVNTRYVETLETFTVTSTDSVFNKN